MVKRRKTQKKATKKVFFRVAKPRKKRYTKKSLLDKLLRW